MKAHLILHVGITGMRLLTEGKEVLILSAVQTVLREIQRTAEAEVGGAACRLKLLSSLAEGVDSMAAEAALEVGYRLQCPLPMPREVYLQTFEQEAQKSLFEHLISQAESVFEPDVSESFSEAYENAAETMLDHSDLLIAVWNGEPTKNIAGTYPTLRSAVRSGIPVIVISTDGEVRVSLCCGGRIHEDWQSELHRVMGSFRALEPLLQTDGGQEALFRLLHPMGYARRFSGAVALVAPSVAAQHLRCVQREVGVPNVRLTEEAMQEFLRGVCVACAERETSAYRLLATRAAELLSADDSLPSLAGCGRSLSSLRDMCRAAESTFSPL